MRQSLAININKNSKPNFESDGNSRFDITEYYNNRKLSTNYQLPYLSSTQNETLSSYFNQPQVTESEETKNWLSNFLTLKIALKMLETGDLDCKKVGARLQRGRKSS